MKKNIHGQVSYRPDVNVELFTHGISENKFKLAVGCNYPLYIAQSNLNLWLLTEVSQNGKTNRNHGSHPDTYSNSPKEQSSEPYSPRATRTKTLLTTKITHTIPLHIPTPPTAPIRLPATNAATAATTHAAALNPNAGGRAYHCPCA